MIRIVGEGNRGERRIETQFKMPSVKRKESPQGDVHPEEAEQGMGIEKRGTNSDYLHPAGKKGTSDPERRADHLKDSAYLEEVEGVLLVVA